MARLIPVRCFRRIRHREDGATLIEFAFVAPILMLMLMGLFDMAHTQYTSALINGAMQRSARGLSLESGFSEQTNLDKRVIEQVRNVVPEKAEITLEKRSYSNFEDIGEAEEFTDGNGDGICNDGELYVDSNRNGQWDANSGTEGIGGAEDAVLYTVNVEYERMFPMYGLAGLPQEVNLSASTVLRNQPFDTYDHSSDTGSCD